MRWRTLLIFFLFGNLLAAGTLHLKTGEMRTAPGLSLHADGSRRLRTSRSHYLLQFNGPIDEAQLALLAQKGATVTAAIPDFALTVAVGDDFATDGLDLQFAGPLPPTAKRSELTGSAYVIEFHSDIDPGDARALVAAQGLTVIEHPSLAKNHLLVTGPMDGLEQWDEVAYIFPASDDLLNGQAVYACGALSTTEGSVPMYATTGHGWPVNGLNGATIQYVFGKLTEKLAPAVAMQEIARALAQWPKFANVHFLPGTDPNAAQTIAIQFASGDHGDGNPFDGPGGILAHTFYPTPTNPEPIAGDMHFDDAENWHSGADVDLYSVALHEIGHALGLGHTDQPGSVMYPYYRFGAQISTYDIGAVQSLYGPPNGSAPAAPAPPATPTPAPISLTIDNPSGGPLQTTAATEALAGKVANARGTAAVTWQTDHGYAGSATGSAAWSILSAPLAIGSNTITVTAIDSEHATDSKSAVVIRNSITPPVSGGGSGAGKTPPTLSISSPATTIYQTDKTSITVTGSAADEGGVAKVTWRNVLAGAGTAAGTTAWSAANIPLYQGTNTLIFTAVDNAGNSSWRSVTVVRR